MPKIEIFLLSVFRFIVSIFDLWLVWVENICNNIKKSNFTKPLSKKIVIREPLFKRLRLRSYLFSKVSVISVSAPSPVILQAVPKLSCNAKIVSSNAVPASLK